MESLESICESLALAAELMTNPSTSKEMRLQAYSKIEEFKESSPHVIEISFSLLSSSSSSLSVVVFALKTLEDAIKIRWNLLDPSTKLSIKEKVMRLIDSDFSPSPSRSRSPPRRNESLTSSHYKDGISRIVVEIIKREWPQQWPSLLYELNSLCCSGGETQTEIVMLTFLRLIEDVAVLQNLHQTQRRKEIYSALTANMENIFSFLSCSLDKHLSLYHSFSSESQKQVVKSVLNTLCAFVEVIPLSLVLTNDGYLLRILTHLLNEEALRFYAVECLLNILSNKQSKIPDKILILRLFESNYISAYFSAIEIAEKSSETNRCHYDFLKKMVLLLVELGSALLCGSSKEQHFVLPPNFDSYLQALLFFSSHSSHTIALTANELMNKFFRSNDISSLEIFSSYVFKWQESVFRKVVKETNIYSINDFEDDENFNSFFSRYKIVLLEGFRLSSSLISPAFIFESIKVWTLSLLKSSELRKKIDELESISGLLDAVLSKNKWSSELLSSACSLLKALLDWSPEKAEKEMCTSNGNGSNGEKFNNSSSYSIQSALLSIISSLFFVVTIEPNALLPVMNKIFSCISEYSGGATEEGRGGGVTLRRHGCALLVKISLKFPTTLFPLFTHLKETIFNLRSSESISRNEFSVLAEALVLLSNEYKNYEIQSEFLRSLSLVSKELLQNMESFVVSSPEDFIIFLGLSDVAFPNKGLANRQNLSFLLSFILNLCRRSRVPKEVSELKAGGFVVHESHSRISIRNPMGSILNDALPFVFPLVRNLNSLWNSELMNKYGYEGALGVLSSEIVTATGKDLRSSHMVKSPLDKLKAFTLEIYENVFYLLSEMCNLGHEFYQMTGLPEALLNQLLFGIPSVPDYRLRFPLKTFIKNFVVKCPRVYYSSVLFPFLNALTPYMYHRLSEKWKIVDSFKRVVYSSSSLGSELNDHETENDSLEIFEDYNIRTLTKEYLDVLRVILTSGDGSDVLTSDSSPTSSPTPLSELGLLYLTQDNLSKVLLSTLLSSLVWNDSVVSVKGSGLLELSLSSIVSSSYFSSSEARQIMISILSALHLLGQHDLNYIALTQCGLYSYEKLRFLFPVVAQVLSELPGINLEDLKRFDEKVLGNGDNGQLRTSNGDKVKKDMFKKLMSPFIGKDVATMFKKEVFIKNLPTLQNSGRNRVKNQSLEESEVFNMGLPELFGSSSSSSSSNNNLSSSSTTTTSVDNIHHH